MINVEETGEAHSKGTNENNVRQLFDPFPVTCYPLPNTKSTNPTPIFSRNLNTIIMLGISLIEWLGYFASVVVAASLTMSSIIKLRWLNLAGSILFTIYAFLIFAIPVLVVNSLIVVVNIVYLIKMYTRKDYLRILEIKPDSLYLSAFLDFYQDEIHRDYPELDQGPLPDRLTFLILRNMAVAGVFLGRQGSGSVLNIELDYVIPQYRDYKSGRFLLIENQKLFREKGFKTLAIETKNNRSKAYFKKMGFAIDKENPALLSKDLDD